MYVSLSIYKHVYIYIYIYICIYIHTYIHTSPALVLPGRPREGAQVLLEGLGAVKEAVLRGSHLSTATFRGIPYGPENSTPLNQDCA